MRCGDWAYDPTVLIDASRHGAIRVAALVKLGMNPRTAYRRCVPGGPWQRPLPGVVLLGSSPPTRQQLVAAALLYAGPDAVVTGLESCRRHGLRNAPPDPQVHVLVPHRHKVGSSDYVVVERTTRLPAAVTVEDVPLAPLPKSVLDACRRLREHDPVRALIAEAVQRRRLTPNRLAHELETGSQRGTAVPREVLRDVLDGARSVAEIDAMRVWERTGLPRPVWNVPLRTVEGEHIATPDAWFEVGLAWEIDSYEYHYQREDYARTVARNARYAACGVTVLQTLPVRLRSEPDKVAAELAAAHTAAARGPAPEVAMP
jgi:hypothetical protein